MSFSKRILIYFSLLAVIFSCSPAREKENTEDLTSLPLSYAQGFSISQGEGYKIVEVTQAYPGEHDPFRYLIVEDAGLEPDYAAYDAVIILPVERIVLTSTTQVPHLDLLEISARLVGFPNTDLISSNIMRKRIGEGKVTDLGKGPHANMEMVIDLNPGLIVLSTVGDNFEQMALLKKAAIPAVLNGEYAEQDPLGRAEWIKFTGAITGKYDESVAAFEEIEVAYDELKAIIASTTFMKKPKVISGTMYKDIWYAPAAESWGALFLEDAGADYVFKNESGAGSLQLNYEYVLEKALDADIWIGAADFKDLGTMRAKDQRYSNFKAFELGEVYTYTHKKGATGGLEYFELGYMRPDIILKDLIKIFHPEQLPDYQPYFYQKLN